MSRVLLPQDLDQLWQMLAEHPGAALYAGGTDLLVRRRRGLVRADTLVCLERVQELKAIERRQGEILLGAGATCAELLEHPLVREELSVLARGLRELGSPPVRHMATLGGNLVTASPAGDTIPPLMVLGARVELRSAAGSRQMPLKQFITGPGRAALEPGEILFRVRVPAGQDWTLQHFEKVGTRKALAISIASLAAVIRLDDAGRVQKARFAWGSVAPTVLASPELDAMLQGRPLNHDSLAELGRAAARLADPISDQRASRDFRLALVANLPQRLSPQPDR